MVSGDHGEDGMKYGMMNTERASYSMKRAAE
jgi:hypothetical protein